METKPATPNRVYIKFSGEPRFITTEAAEKNRDAYLHDLSRISDEDLNRAATIVLHPVDEAAIRKEKIRRMTARALGRTAPELPALPQ